MNNRSSQIIRMIHAPGGSGQGRCAESCNCDGSMVKSDRSGRLNPAMRAFGLKDATSTSHLSTARPTIVGLLPDVVCPSDVAGLQQRSGDLNKGQKDEAAQYSPVPSPSPQVELARCPDQPPRGNPKREPSAPCDGPPGGMTNVQNADADENEARRMVHHPRDPIN